MTYTKEYPPEIMACLSFIRFTIYENQTRINRSTLDMTRLCYVFPLRFRDSTDIP